MSSANAPFVTTGQRKSLARRYGADVRLPGMLYGKILRSPHAHARICSIDTRHAEELPGVHAVITAANLAQPSGRLVDLAEGVLHNMRFLSNNIMAADKVLYKGHAVAAVAATSPHIAEEALSLIQVEYEVLPARTYGATGPAGRRAIAARASAAVSNANLRPGGFLNDDDPTPGTNLANRFEFRFGDVEKGFQEADVIVGAKPSRRLCTRGISNRTRPPRSGTVMAR